MNQFTDPNNTTVFMSGLSKYVEVVEGEGWGMIGAGDLVDSGTRDGLLPSFFFMADIWLGSR